MAMAETRVVVVWPEENRVVWGMNPRPLPAGELPSLSFGDQWVSLMTAEPLWGLRKCFLFGFLVR